MLKLKDPVCVGVGVGGRNNRLGDQTREDEQDRVAPETWPTFQVASSWEVLPSQHTLPASSTQSAGLHFTRVGTLTGKCRGEQDQGSHCRRE